MSGFVQWGMERVTSTMIGTDGDVDAILYLTPLVWLVYRYLVRPGHETR